ncbi:crossover junction endodeoxyribonuclease RuvC [Corynebacterium sp.]|uniref:crossover junction endodeoxyribonuclease RuvC n=1 Tax=Corynebacterium sp. TaxID=1720 RepID=UPI0026DDC2C8|nr:crossover junction endodeoxyribonuclease RuvC [Corynebacterium sp.]MDO5031745.1 crossover junction endodeoxyribonuclease RuvC [Corynebacterium sp.]
MNLEGLRVMGIDPGLTRCGLSVVQAGRGRSVIPIAVGVVRTPSDKELGERLQRLSVAVRDWMDEYQPQVVAIERVFERGEVSTVMQTAHAVGVLVLAAAERDIPVHMYTPSEVKKAVSGNGRADKKQMTAMITRILGLSEPPKPADAADALALAVCHCWRAPALAWISGSDGSHGVGAGARTSGVKGRSLRTDSLSPAAKAAAKKAAANRRLQ